LFVCSHTCFVDVVGASRPDQPLDIPRDILKQTLTEAATNGFLTHVNVGVTTIDKFNDNDDEKRIIVAKKSDTLLSCFGGMAQEGAVGVVDDVDGTLWGNVSPWDLKFLNHHSLISLALPVETFLHHVREKMMMPADYLVSVTPTTTIEALLRQMTGANVEKIYVVDKDKKPIGVVTAIELLGVLSQKKK